MIRLEYGGRMWTLREIAEEVGVPLWLIYKRRGTGWTTEELFYPKSVGRRSAVKIDGETVSVLELSRRAGCSTTTVHSRLKRGVTGPDLIAPVEHITVTVDGQEKRLRELADDIGTTYETIWLRHKRGKKRGKINSPVVRRPRTQITYMGRTQSMADWCRELGIPYSRTEARYRMGIRDPEELFGPRKPAGKKKKK